MSYGIDGDNRYELVTIRVGEEALVVRAELLKHIYKDSDGDWKVELTDESYYIFLEDEGHSPTINGQEINPLAKAAEDRPACCEGKEAPSVTINASNLADAEKIADAILKQARTSNITGYL